jgi:transposase
MSRANNWKFWSRPILFAPYSLALNPIEFAFSKLKSLLRKAAAHNCTPYGKPSEIASTLSL